MPEERSRPAPILIGDRFLAARQLLLQLLESLSPSDWRQPTAAPLWSVKDVALHLLGGDFGNLSRRRDRFQEPGNPITGYRELVAFINSLNEDWVRAARRMSPRVLCDLLSVTGPQLAAYFAGLDLFALGDPVSWAGPERVPVWMDVAREYTEQWHHQQQIRDATHREPLYSPHFFAPVLDAFMRAMPHAYRDTAAVDGAVVEIEITGEAGGRWFVQRNSEGWELLVEAGKMPEAVLSIPQDAAWRLFTKGMPPEQARSLATVRGDSSLADPFFQTIAVLA